MPTTPIPINVLATAEACIRQALAGDPTGSALPSVPEAVQTQAIEGWRANNPVPAGGRSLIDKAASLLRTIVRDLYEPFRNALATGRIDRPALTDAGLRLQTATAIKPQTQGQALFLIEEYRLTSFLGRGGVGRTLTTMSLLPGEETTIRLKTWRNSSTTRTDTSSVVDSEDLTVSEKFARKLTEEASSTTTQQASSSWYFDAKASAHWGVASADVSGGATGETQTGRESFARGASEQVTENAREARSQRKLEVTQSTTTTVMSGAEDSIDRIVKNVNLRRTLNFLFRELNQEYITRLHMTGVRFAYAVPGKEGTWVEYSLAELPDLLDRHIVPERRGQVAADILSSVATVHDLDLRPVHPLQLLTANPDGTLVVTDLEPGNSGLNPIEMPLKGSRRTLRWKPGPLHAGDGHDHASDRQTDTDPFAVDGVCLSQQSTVMPTGTIVVEAQLGQRDALDDYAMRAQEAQLAASEAASARETLLNDALGKLDPEQRVHAYAEAVSGSEARSPT